MADFQAGSLTQRPQRFDDATPASMNCTPLTPSATVGKSTARPSLHGGIVVGPLGPLGTLEPAAPPAQPAVGPVSPVVPGRPPLPPRSVVFGSIGSTVAVTPRKRTGGKRKPP